jgi:hypothetical protein
MSITPLFPNPRPRHVARAAAWVRQAIGGLAAAQGIAVLLAPPGAGAG